MRSAGGKTHVLLRGNPNLTGDEVEPGVPEVLSDGSPTFGSGPGKRQALADWLTDRRNPRTARVLVNRLWQYHFGRGLVPTPNDFGKLGESRRRIPSYWTGWPPSSWTAAGGSSACSG